jgi:S-(hydroxymethyl)glutathione dehydrogenase/alcohol dehydrogenase
LAARAAVPTCRRSSTAIQKRIEVDRLITRTMPLDRINNAFALMHDGKPIRSVIVIRSAAWFETWRFQT